MNSSLVFTERIIGIGVDITEVERIRRLYEKRPSFFKRFFTGNEIDYCLQGKNTAERLAARFAAKEAVIKALDRKNLPLKSISVSHSGTGKPEVSVRVRGLENVKLMLSMSHTPAYACAYVIAFACANRGLSKK